MINSGGNSARESATLLLISRIRWLYVDGVCNGNTYGVSK